MLKHGNCVRQKNNSENNDILLRSNIFNSGVVIFQPNKDTCCQFYLYLKMIYLM